MLAKFEDISFCEYTMLIELCSELNLSVHDLEIATQHSFDNYYPVTNLSNCYSVSKIRLWLTGNEESLNFAKFIFCKRKNKLDLLENLFNLHKEQ